MNSDELFADMCSLLVVAVLGTVAIMSLCHCVGTPSKYAEHPSAMDRRIAK